MTFILWFLRAWEEKDRWEKKLWVAHFIQNTFKASTVTRVFSSFHYLQPLSQTTHISIQAQVKRQDKQKGLWRRQREVFSDNKLVEFTPWQNTSSLWLSLINLYGIGPQCTEGLTHRGMIFVCVLYMCVLCVCVCVCVCVCQEESHRPSRTHSPRFCLLQAHHQNTPTHLPQQTQAITTWFRYLQGHCIYTYAYTPSLATGPNFNHNNADLNLTWNLISTKKRVMTPSSNCFPVRDGLSVPT